MSILSKIKEYKAVVVCGASIVIGQIVNQILLPNQIKFDIIDNSIIGYGIYVFARDMIIFFKEKSKLINNYDDMLSMEEANSMMTSLLNTTSKKTMALFNRDDNKEFQNFMKLLDCCESFRKNFQSETIYNSLLEIVVRLDEDIKVRSLAIEPTYVPLYSIYDDEEDNKSEKHYKFLNEKLEILLRYRDNIAFILSSLSKNYKDAPYSIVRNIVTMSLNPLNTYGLRRYATKLLGNLANHRKENCRSIVKANGLMVLYYYKISLYNCRKRETDTIKYILDNIGFSSYQEYTRNLQAKDAKIVQELFESHKAITLASNACVIPDFFLNLYLSNDIKTALITSGYMVMNVNIREKAKIPLVSLALTLGMVSIVQDDFKNELGPSRYDRLIPSAELIEKAKQYKTMLEEFENDNN
ncbi:hypothetical protein PPL_11404 [Heterostelium album PN500]|uniref:Uncharacterized protein n=1 Tax=Heterostelium pallidum (strain ATCC 26659 / Pp 5 / PN500) TaxID=670386 RepID=D3BTB1_HETP5|nr:hypothetical protein PPL_11404 [Heterostelium album PN500]EFA75328.1 hypothetical protein PPL_11404 [Heterostelium album PN500]|eukprot:XP_020427462.1 hypothetical protein PPL_11404 [Heterostelium album PN500]